MGFPILFAIKWYTHWRWRYMAYVLQTFFFPNMSLKDKFSILIKIYLKFIPERPIENKAAFGSHNGLGDGQQTGYYLNQWCPCVLTHIYAVQCQKIEKIFTGPTYNFLRLGLTVISDVHRPFIPNKTTFTRYGLTQWANFRRSRAWQTVLFF